MKNIIKKTSLLLLFTLGHLVLVACDVCDARQPKITRGITHGAGPQSNWDWVIISIISVITLLTLVYSLKYLLKPGENNADHIKQSIFIN